MVSQSNSLAIAQESIPENEAATIQELVKLSTELSIKNPIRLYENSILKAIVKALKKLVITNPLQEQYWSTLAIALKPILHPPKASKGLDVILCFRRCP